MAFSQELHDAITAAKEAGRIVMTFYHKSYKIKEKKDHTEVTEADMAAQKCILKLLQAKYSYPILSEESKDDLSRLRHKQVWIVDPLDGTHNFVNKTGDFSVVIGLCENHKPILGVVYLPATNTLYFAEKGKGAFKQVASKAPKRIRVSKRTKNLKMAASLLNPKSHDAVVAKTLGVRSIRRAGSRGVKVSLIAEGQADFYIYAPEKHVGDCDTCGPEIIVKEAGGEMTDFWGKQLKYNQRNVYHSSGLVVSNGLIHPKVIKKIKPLLKKS